MVTTTTMNNNLHQGSNPPPAVNITKKLDLSGQLFKKDRRQVSSRFNVNKQNCEIESLPTLKGK
jgi:hypothetical protein